LWPRSRLCVVQEVCWLADGTPAHCPPLVARPRCPWPKTTTIHEKWSKAVLTNAPVQAVRRACTRLRGSERPFCACIRCPRQRPWASRLLIPHGIAKLVILDLRAVISWNPRRTVTILSDSIYVADWEYRNLSSRTSNKSVLVADQDADCEGST